MKLEDKSQHFATFHLIIYVLALGKSRNGRLAHGLNVDSKALLYVSTDYMSLSYNMIDWTKHLCTWCKFIPHDAVMVHCRDCDCMALFAHGN